MDGDVHVVLLSLVVVVASLVLSKPSLELRVWLLMRTVGVVVVVVIVAVDVVTACGRRIQTNAEQTASTREQSSVPLSTTV